MNISVFGISHRKATDCDGFSGKVLSDFLQTLLREYDGPDFRKSRIKVEGEDDESEGSGDKVGVL